MLLIVVGIAVRWAVRLAGRFLGRIAVGWMVVSFISVHAVS